MTPIVEVKEFPVPKITRIVVESIPHELQRYPTCGDWFFAQNETRPDGMLKIRVSRMPPHYEMLVAIHEIIEAYLCTMEGVTQDIVDNFDIIYEETRPKEDFNEPGDSIQAPYYKQHQVATGVERMLVGYLGLSWDDYETTIDMLDQQKGRDYGNEAPSE